ncbi:serologically defined colon cancer antigen 8 homolog isoform X2 [Plodia interpunctella]|uniref:serologically defined colon cancer antigen 8 homolog isoform X2 n=1 Tax=Plodia interpunctella TaxID=58824 RepID=UPI0023684AA3|nr:serologically defined colon cancer antigen 8 homolog isoform X2 [Plodia interpunctella]
MGSTSYLGKPKSSGYRAKSASSVGSDKEMNGKLRRSKIRRPTRMNEYGLKRVPDYTELAYKEAVSKLRYFLSGTYAPSVRSYGGSPSLKNLDESDGDLDKKYTSYNTLAEYKPRPRLTAKYATLYADSLNNYTPQHVSSTPNVTVTSPADPGSAPNPDVINFIQKQEEYIEQLERESQYCRDELNNLLGKVKEVISENEHLHEAQKNKLISRMFHSYNAGSETDELDDLGDSTGLDSDNKGTPKRKGVKQRSSSVRLEGPNIVFESRIAELEAQLTQAKIDLKKVQDENNENKRKLASGLVDSTCLDGFKRQIDNLQRDKSSLEAQISKLKLSLDQKEGDLDSRYKRSEAEHQLREERNCLEIEIRRLKDELGKERSRVRELASEGSRRAVRERSAAEQRYTAHFDELQHDLAAQYDNVSKLQLDLERQRREENDLKRELSMKNAAIEELKMELKNKTSSLQADLAQAHAEKASLEEELARARLAIERLQRQAKHDANRLNSEIQSLRQRLDRADADLVHSRRENLRLSEQISTLEKEVNMKTLTPVTPEKKKDLSMMMESMENKHAPPTSTPTAHRTVPHPPSDAGPDHPRTEPAGLPKGDTVPSFRPDRIDGNDHQAPRTSRQHSRSSLLSHANIDDDATKGEDNFDTDVNYEQKDEKTMDVEQEKPKEFEPEAYNEGNFNYEQNYQQNPEQTYEETPADYQNAGYEQNYEQQPYTTEQYGNYEQYPEQQYVDPNAQYEGQYENYGNDGNYEQNYDNTQYNQEYPTNNETTDKQNVQYNENYAANQEKHETQENKTNNAPKEQLSSQS